MEGYLWKKGSRGILTGKGWKRRWFWLVKPNRVFYSVSSTETDSPINFILLNEHTSVSTEPEVYNQGKGKSSFQIRCSYTHRIYHLEAPSPEEMNGWIFSILELVQLIRKNKETRDLSTLQLPTRIVKRKNHPVLDVVVGELHCEGLSGEIFCALYCNDLKFKTWRYRKPQKEPAVWNICASFLNPASHLVFRLFQTTSIGDQPLIEEMIIPVEVFMDGEIKDEWFNFELKGSSGSNSGGGGGGGLKGSVRLQLHLTTAYDKDALLEYRGIPVEVLPVRLNSGDIILFNNNRWISFGTKLFTWSQWDHVAIVVRTAKNRLKLLEVTGEGVGYYDLDSRIEFLATVSKIGVRFLETERTPFLHNAIWEFAEEVKGRPFKQDLMEMVNASQKRRQEEDQTSLFCSQLVAAAFQRMGLMSKERSSNEYIPKDWASKKNSSLQLTPGVTLIRKLIFKIRDDSKKDKTKKRTASSDVLATRLRSSTSSSSPSSPFLLPSTAAAKASPPSSPSPFPPTKLLPLSMPRVSASAIVFGSDYSGLSPRSTSSTFSLSSSPLQRRFPASSTPHSPRSSSSTSSSPLPTPTSTSTSQPISSPPPSVSLSSSSPAVLSERDESLASPRTAASKKNKKSNRTTETRPSSEGKGESKRHKLSSASSLVSSDGSSSNRKKSKGKENNKSEEASSKKPQRQQQQQQQQQRRPDSLTTDEEVLLAQLEEYPLSPHQLRELSRFMKHTPQNLLAPIPQPLLQPHGIKAKLKTPTSAFDYLSDPAQSPFASL